jgi:hypothetical protein
MRIKAAAALAEYPRKAASVLPFTRNSMPFASAPTFLLAAAVVAILSPIAPAALQTPHPNPRSFAKVLVGPPPSFYPRAIQDSTTATWLAAIETPTPAARALSFATASTSQSPVLFSHVSTIFSSSEVGADVANPHLLQFPPSSIPHAQPRALPSPPPLLLCAFRHHSMSAAPVPVYRIQVSSSVDNGLTWYFLPVAHRTRDILPVTRDTGCPPLTSLAVPWGSGSRSCCLRAAASCCSTRWSSRMEASRFSTDAYASI